MIFAFPLEELKIFFPLLFFLVSNHIPDIKEAMGGLPRKRDKPLLHGLPQAIIHKYN